jgi:hypothetical protein
VPEANEACRDGKILEVDNLVSSRWRVLRLMSLASFKMVSEEVLAT